jgi:hypothetical protein
VKGAWIAARHRGYRGSAQARRTIQPLTAADQGVVDSCGMATKRPPLCIGVLLRCIRRLETAGAHQAPAFSQRGRHDQMEES